MKVILKRHTSAKKKSSEWLHLHAAGADFVKTSTGFNGAGAQVDDVALISRLPMERSK